MVRLYSNRRRRHNKKPNKNDDGNGNDNDDNDDNDDDHENNGQQDQKQQQQEEEEQDDDECCEECDGKKTKVKVTYRPLVNSNGAFLCDACYKSKFPATAMCDESFQNSNVFSKLKDQTLGAVAAVKKQQQQQQQQVFPEEEECCSCLEHGIFRRCCDKYYCRQCYYHNPQHACPGCNTPVYTTGTGGGEDGENTVTGGRPAVTRISVVASWGISIGAYLTCLLFLCTAVINWTTKPLTLWGHTCHGWFPQCTEPVCIDFGDGNKNIHHSSANDDDDNVNGMIAMENIPYEYKFCSIDRTVNKVIGNACIFDPELYRWSDQLLGFDICTNDRGKKNEKEEDGNGSTSTSTTGSTTISSSHGNDYENGVFVFEDNFDYWSMDNVTNYSPQSIAMKSARWHKMENAMASDICGYNNITRPYEHEQQRQYNQRLQRLQRQQEEDESNSTDTTILLHRHNASLVFTGVRARFAETVDLNVEHGGRIEFYLKLAPIVPNELATECKTAFLGDVQLSYSVDGGLSYVTMKLYPVWKYRQHSFQFVMEDIPYDAQTPMTRFRWDQVLFDPQRDYWALDDVRVFHQWPTTTTTSHQEQGEVVKEKREDHVRSEQCCYDTEQCDAFPNRRQGCNSASIHSDSGSGRSSNVDEGEYHAYDYTLIDEKLQDGSFRFKSVDIYLTLSAIVLVVRKGFRDLYQWTVASYKVNKKKNAAGSDNGRGRGRRKDDAESDQCSSSSQKNFQLDMSKSWQRFAMFTLCLPQCTILALLITHLILSWDFYSNSTFSTIYLIVLPCCMDLWIVRRLGLDVFHYWPFHIPPHIQIDASDEKELLILIGNDSNGDHDDEITPLLDIRNVEVYSTRFYVMIFVSVWFGGLPFSSMSVLIKTFAGAVGHDTYVAMLHILGTFSVVRSILGPLWFVEVVFSVRWLSSISVSSRDDMGRACRRPAMRHTLTNSAIISVFVLLPIILQQFWNELNAQWVLVLIFSSLALGIIVGSTIGLLRGLPVVPRIILTCWPDDGYCFISDRNSKDAEILSKLFSGGMNSAALYLFPVDQMDSFRAILSGTLSLHVLLATEQAEKDKVALAGSKQQNENVDLSENEMQSTLEDPNSV